MENKEVKKVIVELNDGSKTEFTGDVVMFAEDEMSGTEKLFKGNDYKKMCGVVQCSTSFLVTVVDSALDTLEEKNPGLAVAVMMKHLDDAKLMAVLADILG